MNTDQISEQLTLQLHCIEQLEHVLELEKQALIDRDIEKIEGFAQQKEALMVQLSQLDQQVEQLLAKQPLPTQLEPLKTQITEGVTVCQQQNLENGKAIDLSIESLNRLQSSIIKKRSGNSMTYNAKGKTRGAGSSSGYISA